MQGGAFKSVAKSVHIHQMDIDMRALTELFTTDAGLASVAGIAFMLGMGVFFIRYFRKHIREDGERAAAAALKR
jgi:hypothetical protein